MCRVRVPQVWHRRPSVLSGPSRRQERRIEFESPAQSSGIFSNASGVEMIQLDRRLLTIMTIDWAQIFSRCQRRCAAGMEYAHSHRFHHEEEEVFLGVIDLEGSSFCPPRSVRGPTVTFSTTEGFLFNSLRSRSFIRVELSLIHI